MLEVDRLLAAQFDVDDGHQLALDLHGHVADPNRLLRIVEFGDGLAVGADLRERGSGRAAVGAKLRAGLERRLTGRTRHAHHCYGPDRGPPSVRARFGRE